MALGLRYATMELLGLSFVAGAQDLFGLGLEVGANAEMAPLRRVLAVAARQPRLFGTNSAIDLELHRVLEVGPAFDRFAIGGSLMAGYEPLAGLRISAGWLLDQVQVTPSNAMDIVLARIFREGVTNALRLSLEWDQRDDPILPTRGVHVRTSLEWAPDLGIFKEENVFRRVLAEARAYWPFSADVVGRFTLAAGWIQSPDAEPPMGERFFGGGGDSLRGFAVRSISPRIYTAGHTLGPLRAIAIGGNKELLLTAELEFPLVRWLQLRGVAFFDAGNVFGREQDFLAPGPVEITGLLMSAGLGLRWLMPLGPIRLDWAVPLTPRRGDGSYRIELALQVVR